jgi:hypothetical protein
MIDPRWYAAFAALLLSLASAVEATTRTNAAFRRPDGQPLKIVVLPPDVTVGSIGIGGVEEPNADWTAAARNKLASQIEAQQRANGNLVIFLPEQDGERAKLVADYQALFRTVAAAAADHEQGGAATLPTKRDRFDWTLGPGAARLAEVGGGDFALFVMTHDAFGTGGRKAFRLLTGGLAGALVQGSGVHHSYAALVELKTGDLVWFNVDPGSGGDPRTDTGAGKRMGQLFGGFPWASR